MSNSWAAAVLRYFYAVVRWSKWDMRKLDRQTRAIMKQNQAHHIYSSITRPYLPRSKGGRGLTNIEHVWEREAISTVVMTKSRVLWSYEESCLTWVLKVSLTLLCMWTINTHNSHTERPGPVARPKKQRLKKYIMGYSWTRSKQPEINKTHLDGSKTGDCRPAERP